MNWGGSALLRWSKCTGGGLFLALAVLISGCGGLHWPMRHAPPVEVKTPQVISPEPRAQPADAVEARTPAQVPDEPAPPAQTVTPVEVHTPIPVPAEPSPPVHIVKPIEIQTPVPVPVVPAPTVQVGKPVPAVEAVQVLKPLEPAPVVLPPPKAAEPIVALVSPPPPRPAPTVQEPHYPGSQAMSAREYRKDAAGHLYKKYADRIYAGVLPAMLQAVAVVEVDVNKQGAVTDFRWLRAPRHAPRVMTEIEGMVYASAPFPAPHRMGTVTYTETWLWDHSGLFQLDTLTEGQR